MGFAVMVFGFFLLVLGVPASIIVCIVCLIRKKHVTVSIISVPTVAIISLVMLVVGCEFYTRTDEYKQIQLERQQEEALEAAKKAEMQKESEDEEEKDSSTKQEEKKETEKTSVKKKEEKVNSFTYLKTDVEFVDYAIEQNMTGETCLVLYFDFSNNSKENQTFDYLFTTKAFQGGVELETSLFHVNDESKNASKEIRPGTKVRVAESFIISDGATEVDIEIVPFSIWSDKKLSEFKLDISKKM